MTTTWSLAVDLGTVNTAAAVVVDGVISPLELEGSALMPSAVFRRGDGTLAVGREAVAAIAREPDSGTLSPSRQVGSPAPLLLGDAVVSTVEALAAVLRAVADAGRALHGEGPDRVVVSHPARWESRRQRVLREAVAHAGLPEPLLVEDPVAVVAHHGVPAPGDAAGGELVAVLDLGADGAEMAVVRRVGGGAEVVGMPRGDERLGGDQLDHEVFRHLGGHVAASDPAVWDALLHSDDPGWRAAAVELARRAREVKELLAVQPRAEVQVPGLGHPVTVTRSELEGVLRPHVERAADTLSITVASAGVRDGDLAAVYLVGGTARLPLAARLLAERYGDRLVLRDDPTQVVALGAARLLVDAMGGADRSPSASSSGPVAAADRPASGVRPSQLERPPVSQVPRAEPPLAAAAAGPVANGAPPVSAGGVDAPLDVSAEQPATLVWQSQLPRLATGLGCGPGGVAAVDGTGQLTVLDPGSGAKRWTLPLGALQAAPAVSGDVVVSAGHDGRLLGLSVADGSLRWQVQLGAGEPCRPALVGPGGGVAVVATAAGLVHAVDAASGTVLWQVQCHTSVVAPAAGTEALVVVATSDGSVYGIEVATGAARWSFRSAAGFVAAPSVAPDVVHLGGLDGMVTCLETETGRPRWGLVTTNQLHSAPLRTPERVRVVPRDGVLHEIDALSGALVWRWAGPGLSGHPAARGTTVLVPTAEGQLCAIDGVYRRLRWRVDVGWQYPATPLPLGDQVVVGTAHAVVMALADPQPDRPAGAG